MSYGRYKCWSCKEPGEIRVFSGQYGSGWAACTLHKQEAFTLALEPISSSSTAKGYAVTCYPVTWKAFPEGPHPSMGPYLWRVVKK